MAAHTSDAGLSAESGTHSLLGSRPLPPGSCALRSHRTVTFMLERDALWERPRPRADPALGLLQATGHHGTCPSVPAVAPGGTALPQKSLSRL